MDIKKAYIAQKTNEQQNAKTNQENTSLPKFKSLLSKYIENYHELSSENLEQNKLSQIINNKILDSNYNSFNQVKLKNQNLNPTSREEKLSLIKKQIEEGFYLKDEIIAESAGKIIDSFIL